MELCLINIEKLKEKLADFHVIEQETIPENIRIKIGGITFSFRYIEIEWDTEKSSMKMKNND